MLGLRRRFRRWVLRRASRYISDHDPLRDPHWLRPLQRGRLGTGADALADSAWVYRCVRVLADNAAKVPLLPYAGAEGDAVVVEGGPWAQVLRRPNPRDSRSKLVWRTVALKETTGACFWLLEGNGRPLEPLEIPTEIWPLAPGLFRPVDPTASIPEAWWMRQSDGTDRLIEPHQLAIHRYPDPRSAWGWISPLRAAAENVETEILARRRNASLLRNNAQPAGHLEVDEDTFDDDAAIKRLRAQWAELYGGADNAGRFGIVPPGAKWHPTGLAPKDLDWLGGLKWDRQTVAAVFGVPLFMLGIPDENRRGTTEETRRFFWQETEEPILVTLAEDVQHDLVEPRGGGAPVAAIGAPSRRETAVVVRFDFSGIPQLQLELADRLDAAEKGRRLGIPLNELIRAHGLPYDSEQPHGDEGLLPMGLVPVEVVHAELEDLEEPVDPAPPGGVPDELEDDEDPDVEGDQDDDEDDRSARLERFLWIPEGQVAEGAEDYELERRHGLLVWTRNRRAAAREAMWAEHIRSIRNPGERAIQKIVRAYLRGRLTEVGNALRRFSREVVDYDGLDDWMAEQEERWAKILTGNARPTTRKTVAATVNQLASTLGAPDLKVGMEHPAVLRFLSKADERYATISGHQTTRVRRSIQIGRSHGEGLADLQKRIQARFKVDASRSLTIARTETGVASQTPKYSVAQEEGVAGGEWLSAGDEEVRTGHDIDGEFAAIGATFSNGLRHPNDPDGTAENVINCRCDWLARDEALA